MSEAATLALARRIRALEKAVRTQGRASQAAFRGVQVGDQPLSFYDEEGNLRLQIGARTPDGSYTVTELNGGTPPTPTAPVVIPATGGLQITYNGTFVGANAPADLNYVEVHVLLDPNEVPDDSNQVTTFSSTNGGSFFYPITSPVPVYVGLQAVNRSGVESDLSALTTVSPGTGADVDSNGNLIVPGYVVQSGVPYAAASSPAQTIPSGADTTVSGWALVGSAVGIAVAGGVFTATHAGVYQISGCVAFVAGDTGSHSVILLANSTTRRKVSGIGHVGGPVSLNFSDMVPLADGDTVTVKVRQDSGANLDLASGTNYVTITRVA